MKKTSCSDSVLDPALTYPDSHSESNELRLEYVEEDMAVGATARRDKCLQDYGIFLSYADVAKTWMGNTR